MKCKDYDIIKIRTYANPYYLKKFLNDDPIGRQKHCEAAKLHNEFFWNFFEKTTGKNWKEYHWIYGSAQDCAIEELFTDFDIPIMRGEGWQTYFIPKGQFELVDWMRENIKNEWKMPSKVPIRMWRPQPSTWHRETFKRKI